MFFDDYDPDEAHRVVGLTTMLEGHTYTFRIHNTRGMFTVMLESHRFPGLEVKMCRHVDDPCMVEHRSLKDGARECIDIHLKKSHHLSVVV